MDIEHTRGADKSETRLHIGSTVHVVTWRRMPTPGPLTILAMAAVVALPIYALVTRAVSP